MAESRDLVIDTTAGPLKLQSETDLLKGIGETVARTAMELVKDAYECGPMTDEEAVKLTPRQRRIRDAASMCQSEAPIWLVAALRFNEACNRRDADAREARRLNITQNNYISLPAPIPPASPDEVKYVDIEQIKGEADE